jgi:DNA-3-methyladenine glycosylase I
MPDLARDRPELLTDACGRTRCWWCGDDEEYRHYHDHEWGEPVADDQRLFEKISLEGFQCGLSWITILRRRAGFRNAFHQFDIASVAAMKKSDVERLVQDEGIIRHRGKIEATIHNASRALEMQASDGSLAAFFWQYEPTGQPPLTTRDDVQASTEQSQSLSKELKKRGWKFVGPTTCYAFMQSMGIVNDHLVGCDDYVRVERLRERFQRPPYHQKSSNSIQ